jgi:putative component of membrane protein insertase Oxa1/YidC/SpoIIIJ protein YidD
MNPAHFITGKIRYSVIAGIFLIINITVTGQTFSDTTLLKVFQIRAVPNNEYSAYFKNSESEMNIIISSFFIIYKTLISSQDLDVCVFHPSCSVYTMEAVRKKGLAGILDGLDRLMRCHSLAGRNDYPIDSLTKKFYDPF